MCDSAAAWRNVRKARRAVEAPSLHSILSSPSIIHKVIKRCYWFLKECNLEH